MLVMIYNKSKTGMVKVGFSVSKRIGNSVTRNRIKRRLRVAGIAVLVIGELISIHLQ